jgi:hypothetical protein
MEERNELLNHEGLLAVAMAMQEHEHPNRILERLLDPEPMAFTPEETFRSERSPTQERIRRPRERQVPSFRITMRGNNRSVIKNNRIRISTQRSGLLGFLQHHFHAQRQRTIEIYPTMAEGINISTDTDRRSDHRRKTGNGAPRIIGTNPIPNVLSRLDRLLRTGVGFARLSSCQRSSICYKSSSCKNQFQ